MSNTLIAQTNKNGSVSFRLNGLDLFTAVKNAKNIIAIITDTKSFTYAAESMEGALDKFKIENPEYESIHEKGEIDAEEYLLDRLAPPEWCKKCTKSEGSNGALLEEVNIFCDGEKIAITKKSNGVVDDFKFLKNIKDKVARKTIETYGIGGPEPTFWWYWTHHSELSSTSLWR